MRQAEIDDLFEALAAGSVSIEIAIANLARLPEHIFIDQAHRLRLAYLVSQTRTGRQSARAQKRETV